MTFPKTNKDILSFLLHETLYYYTSPLNPKQSPNPTLENQFPKTFPSILSFSSSPFYLPRSNKTFFDRREERGWGEGGVFDRTADKSIPRRAISWFLPSLSLSPLCVCVWPAEKRKSRWRYRDSKWWKEAISIWRSAIDTEKRLAEASPFPDEFSPTRGRRWRRPSRIDLSGEKHRDCWRPPSRFDQIESRSTRGRHERLFAPGMEDSFFLFFFSLEKRLHIE